MKPVHKEDGKWYFFDETWSDRFGPYLSEEEANKKLKEYCEYLNLTNERKTQDDI